MVTKIATLALATAFLNAGAFTGLGVTKQTPGLQNVTDVVKNQARPIKGQITVEPCKLNGCIDL
jgi:hypothetical protein